MTHRIQRFVDRLGVAVRPLWAPVDRRLNPILVKEVRQALRGRYFLVVFWAAVAVAATIGCVALVREGYQPSETGGLYFFMLMYGVLSLALHVFVPFGAFLSIGAEWEENTFDLLVLSDLRPRQIILGKLAASLLQVFLILSGFAPFMVFAFLLRGLDLVGAGWVIGMSCVSSLALSSLALGLSSLSRQRFVRVLLMVFLALTCVYSTVGSVAAVFALVAQLLIHQPFSVQMMLASATTALTVSAFACALAATRFAHPEENRSTPLRVLASFTVFGAIAWMGYLYSLLRQYEVLGVLGVMTVVGLAVLCASFCSEEERLGRRVRLQVARHPLLALLSTPWLPGGGRGIAFFLIHGALVLGALWILPQVFPGTGTSFLLQSHAIPLTVLLFVFVYVGLPTALLARWTKKLSWRIAARGLIPMLAILSVLLPVIAGLFLEDEALMEFRHPANPIWMILEIFESDALPRTYVWVLLAAGVVLAANLPRVFAALRETLSVSRARRSTVPAVKGRALERTDADAPA